MPRLLELFAGTGSVGKSFKKLGWEVVSLDMSPDFDPTIVTDLMDWDYEAYTGEVDAIHASPPCTHYSLARTTAKTPRDLEGSDALVQRTLDIINHFHPKVFIIENPYTGYMKSRPVMQPLRPIMRVVTYCKYGLSYKKATSIWTNLGDLWTPRPACCKASPCEHLEDGVHPQTAQRGPGKTRGVLRQRDKFSLHELYALPEQLCDELAEAATSAVSL